jgi:hypothetical protein
MPESSVAPKQGRTCFLAETQENFWSRVDTSNGFDACWPWTGRKDRDGYGVLYFEGKERRAHRVAFYLTNGRWPEPCCLHDCDNPPCCNPDHLHEGTQPQNIHECVERGRIAKSDRNGRYKTGAHVGRSATRIEYMRAWRAARKEVSA